MSRMSLNHLHLHVRDVERSQRFYSGWFGFAEQVRHGDIVFLRDGGGLDLALAPDPEPASLPPWFHIGFRLDRAEAVRDCYSRMGAALVPITKPLAGDGDYVTFQCTDPDGTRIEVYWE